MADTVKDNIAKETKRIIEDSLYSARGHFAASSRWSTLHFWIGLIATIFAAAAGTSAFTKSEEGSTIAGVLSFVVAILTATITFIKPNNRASRHLEAANKYLSLRNDARTFADITLTRMTIDDSSEEIKILNERRNNLNETSPIIPRWAFKKARKGIEDGEAENEVDKG
jgi:hypothetical protein